MQRIAFRAMGSSMLAALDSEEPTAEAWLNEVPLWFESWERHLSRFRPSSELSALNRNPGRWTTVSAVLWAVLTAALEAAQASDGLVSPALLDAVEAAGYRRDFAAGAWAEQDTPAAGSPAQADAWKQIELDERRRMVRLPADVRLDLGGVAKGWAADEVAGRLGRVAPTLLDAGGDIAVSGPMADGSPWPIAVDDPLSGGAQLDLLLLSAGGVATSGRDFRRWRQGDGYAHHIIDPRTARPAQTDALSATVVGPSALAAEAAAKVALFGGSAGWAATVAREPALVALMVLEDATVLRGPGWPAYCWKN
jgi:thiamine biosynthesis lipoprotein